MPPLISKTILSASILTLVTCTWSPTRAAGPYFCPASAHFCLSQAPVLSKGRGFGEHRRLGQAEVGGGRAPVLSKGRGFGERGRNALTVANSAIMPRRISTRSSSVNFLSAAKAGAKRRQTSVAQPLRLPRRDSSRRF